MANMLPLVEMVQSGEGLPVVEEKVAYKRYLTVWQRSVQFPDGKTVEWDVTGHTLPNPAFVVVFPFNTTKKTTTLIIEYCQGPNQMKYCFPAGAVDRKKHTSVEDAARAELSEEALLKSGQLISLLPEGHEGISELKWGRNKFIPFLVLDAESDENPGQRDDEELIEVVSDVSMERLKEIMLKGELMLPSVQTIVMGVDWLKRNGYLESFF
ncbi:hypothetical protein BJ742DRAFT_794921 [Cladochytrium replicatum]|nr:hypothetical protein BJ742DRAFT_794921 [Cladochytrium replicatum]